MPRFTVWCVFSFCFISLFKNFKEKISAQMHFVWRPIPWAEWNKRYMKIEYVSHSCSSSSIPRCPISPSHQLIAFLLMDFQLCNISFSANKLQQAIRSVWAVKDDIAKDSLFTALFLLTCLLLFHFVVRYAFWTSFFKMFFFRHSLLLVWPQHCNIETGNGQLLRSHKTYHYSISNYIILWQNELGDMIISCNYIWMPNRFDYSTKINSSLINFP